MTTLHNDPFNASQVRKEADDDRKAAEAKLAAQEEARKRTARQRLEADRRRLTAERDTAKRKLTAFMQEAEEAKRNKKTIETKASEKSGVEALDQEDRADAEKKRKLEEELTRVRNELARVARTVRSKAISSEPAPEKAVVRKLSTAHAALEKATLEHDHVSEEIKQLTRQLEQKRQEERHRLKEKTEAAMIVKNLEEEKEEVASAHAAKIRERTAEEAAAAKEALTEKQSLEKEQTKILAELSETEQAKKARARQREALNESLRRAEAEKTRTGGVLENVEHQIKRLSGELEQIEKNLHEVEDKLMELGHEV